MNIRKILYLSTAISIFMTLALVVISLYFSTAIRHRMEHADLAARLAHSTAELTLLTEEYIAYRLQRVELQWNTKIASIRELVSHGAAPEILAILKRDVELLNESFEQLKQSTNKIAQAARAENEEQLFRLKELELRRITRMRLLYTEISRNAFRLSVQARHETAQFQQRNNMLTDGYAILMLLFLGISSVVLIRVIGRKLGVLSASAVLIGQGNLDTVVPDLGSDEIGSLGKTLNQMRAQLQKFAAAEHASAMAIMESEERFRDFAETAADFFWETDAELRFCRLEGHFEMVTGKSPAAVMGQKFANFWSANEQNIAAIDQVETAINARQSFEDIQFYWDYSEQESRIIAFSGKPVSGGAGKPSGYRGSGHDITENQKLSNELLYQATHDSLTDLINRREFERRLRRLLETAKENDSCHILCYLDLDQFKLINDSCGHLAGDELLRQIVAVLGVQLRARDTLARLGGDEFGILFEHCQMNDARTKAEKMRVQVDDFRFVWEGKIFKIGLSVGMVALTKENSDIDHVLRAVDAACYMAKEQGGNRVVVDQQDDDSHLSSRQDEIQWVARINRALDDDRFILYFQPIVRTGDPDSGDLHYEILLRLVSEEGETIPPGAFIPSAERFNLSARLDQWVVQKTLNWLAAHPDHLQQLSLCSINLSGLSIGDADFKHFLLQQIEESQVPAEKICFEITETAAIRNLSMALKLIKSVKDLGCQIALDDFGSGLSSFGYLKKLPVDYLKIDGTFITEILTDSVDLAMVKSINEVGQLLGKQTIAEFVESEAIASKLKEIGFDFCQGYHYGKPRPLASLAAESGEVPLKEVAQQ